MVQNKSFFLIVLTLIVLIAVALWQFYSLAYAADIEHPYVTTTSCPVIECSSVRVH